MQLAKNSVPKPDLTGSKKLKKESKTASEISKDQDKKSGKLLDRFKIRVSEHEFTIEVYNQDLTDENFKKYSVV